MRRQTIDLTLLRDAIEHAPDGMARFGADGTFLFATRPFATILGREPKDVVGTRMDAFVLENQRPIVAEACERARREGRAECEVRVVRSDGAKAHARIIVIDQREQGGFCLLSDITLQKEAEAALRFSEERFRLVCRATRDVITDWDIIADSVWVSEAVHTTFGYPQDLKVSIGFWLDAIHPEDRESVMASHRAAFVNGSDLWTCEYRALRADGRYAYVYDRMYIMRDESGTAIRVVGATTDYTSRKEAEEERLSGQNRMIIESVAEGIVGVDALGKVIFVNASAQAAMGRSIEQILGVPVDELLHHESADGQRVEWARSPLNRSIQTRSEVTSIATIQKENHAMTAFEMISRPLLNPRGDVAGAVVTFRDVTRRLEMERMKKEFISIVSHELRTPLTSIRGALGLLASGNLGEFPEKAHRLLDLAVRNSERLGLLLNDILDLERIESGQMKIFRQRCTPTELIARAVEELEPLAEQANVRLEAARCDVELDADPDRLLQTLTNLIGNAIKYSPPRGTVRVSAHAGDDDVTFSVTDEGCGVPSDKLQLIFERFQQVDASDSRQKGGSGLGLAICRGIVSEHGGNIWAESAVGCGGRFLFSIPRIAPERQRAIA